VIRFEHASRVILRAQKNTTNGHAFCAMRRISMKFAVTMSLLALGTTVALAQPSVGSVNAILNGASYAYANLPNGSIAQGSIFSIFGSKLGPSSSPSLAYPLQTTLGGVSVKVTSGGKTVDAIPVYVGPGQINAILPSDTPTGAATLTVTYNGTSSPASFKVTDHSFGIVAINSAGSGPGVITDANYQVYTLTSSAHPGDASIIWGTGLGAVSSDTTQPNPTDLTSIPVEVYVGDQKASVAYRGRSGCCAAEDQIVITIPAGVTGCHVPVVVKIGNVVSNYVTMPIATSGSVCSDPSSTSLSIDPSKYQQQGSVSIGFVSLDRTTTESSFSIPGLNRAKAVMRLLRPDATTTTTTSDFGSAEFYKYTYTQLISAENPFNIFTVGTCTVITFSGASTGDTGTDPTQPTYLDAGSAITVSGPNGSKQLTKEATIQAYYASLGGGSGSSATPLFLDPGSYTISGPGGKDVGAFSKTLTIAQPLVWTNKDSITTVTRSAGQLVTWSGGDPSGTVVMSGSSILLGTALDGSDSVGAFFTCTSPVSTGKFTIPAIVLLSLPASDTSSIIPIPTGEMSIGTSTFVPFSATGIDVGEITTSVSSGKSVTYQ
jgi:uncharacterized protein (TIGR03437 family)